MCKEKGELLYNGIRLPVQWPPDYSEEIFEQGKNPSPPYLTEKPETILIGKGRELFVDDFLIAESSCKRVFHYPEKYRENPILKPEMPWEINSVNGSSCACPKSGGVWYDYEKKLYRMWYEAGWVNTICCAESRDGIHWERPEYDIIPGTNRVLPYGIKCDSWTVVHDYYTENKEARYKLFLMEPCWITRGMCFTSPDGIHWSKPTATGIAGDRSTMFYNPFRKKWCFSLRAYFAGQRMRNYAEGDDFISASQWGCEPGKNSESKAVHWAGAEKSDPVNPATNIAPQLYNLDAAPYESLMLGFFQLHYGPPNNVGEATGVPKITELEFAYSRDGFHWSRPDRNCAIRCGNGDVWDRGYVQSLGNICTVDEDKINFYYTGFQGDEGSGRKSGMYHRGATGMAFLRRDGFASMDAPAEGAGLLTEKLRFEKPFSRLFVNVESSKGKFLAEILDENGIVAEGFTKEDCLPISIDSTKVMVAWKNGSDLSRFAGKKIRIHFLMENASFYSFWVSPAPDGKSYGYLAGGGPCYHGPIDD